MLYIIIPTYNRAYTILRALDSCAHQKGSCVIVIVDDGSTDNTKEIVENYKATCSKKIIYHYQQNCGVSAACNTGIKIALADSENIENTYITRLGSDDALKLGAVSIYETFIQKHPTNTIFFFKMVHQSGLGHSFMKTEESIINYEEYLSGKYMSGADANDVVKATAFLNKNNFFIDGLHGGDNIALQKIIKENNCCIIINKETYIVYTDTFGMTRSELTMKYCKQLLDVQLKILNIFFDDYIKYNKKLIGIHSLIIARNYGILGQRLKAIKFFLSGIRYNPGDFKRIGLALICLLPYSLYIINLIIRVFITNKRY